MPYLHIHTNVKVENHDAFLAHCSHTMSSVLKKPESFVMTELSDNRSMTFAGSSQPLAFVELKSLGLSPADTAHISQKMSSIIQQELDIAIDRIYIEFESPDRDMFGWKGGTF